MTGFFFANILLTIPAQTGDWGLMSAAMIVAINEILSQIVYQTNTRTKYFCINFINNIKIGTIYGLFVDAFKLGS
uniref:Uncharacterized protein ycf20 n=1 Tax=Bostrychia moritziana TaxID=103713 RepID=A0A1Z1M792_BOSMO|nr:hypothetical protein [Bostrychia moritziana]ARW61624.1 hypothetical protein [Bostrychia moritziana]